MTNVIPTLESIDTLAGKTILILGMGREGQGTAEYIASTYPDATLTIADQQRVKFSLPGVTALYGKKYPESLEAWDLVIIAPGIPPQTPLLTTAKALTNATALFLRECNGTVVMVTGSKGKSTTSAMIYDMIVEDRRLTSGQSAETATEEGTDTEDAASTVHFVGNIGISTLGVLAQHNTVEDLFIMETSSYQARLLDKGPGIAVVTQLFPEHLDYHGSLEQYYADKLRVTTTQTAEQLVIYNASNETLAARMQQSVAKKIAVPAESLADGAQSRDGVIVFNEEPIVNRSECLLLGEHNTANILLAVTAAKQLRASNEAIGRALKAFRPLPHRLEQIGTYKGVTFYNDSLSTTPEATIAALYAIENVQTVFLGGQDRGYDFARLIQELKDRDIQNIILFPDSGATIRAQWGEVKYGTQFFETESMAEAVAFAYKNTPSGGVALLSCASPSYSIFNNYEDRGNQFREYVETQGVE